MRTRKLSAGAIGVIVLSVLLVMSVTVTGTLAWFASQDNAAGQFVLGEPVIVSVTQADTTDTTTLAMTIASEFLLPGMLITPDIAVTLQPSTTATIMRARIDSTVSGGTGDVAVLNQNFRDVLTPVINAGWVLNDTDGWYYFLGEGGLDARVMNTPAETSELGTPEFGATVADYDAALITARNWDATPEDTVLASVVPGATTKTVPFLVNAFRLPTAITNEYATATIDLTFYIEAVQDFLVVGGTNVLPTLTNSTTVFEEISPYTQPIT